ncbi:MAG: hypothetical protein GY788_03770 [bacterium]|nr:hypothetical protein [bacterium]
MRKLSQIRLGRHAVPLPRSLLLRRIIACLLICGGVLGFLPILGFWMMPLGFIVLAVDSPTIRRMNRRIAVAAKRWWNGSRRGARTEIR